MPGRSFQIRYPNGEFEIDAVAETPPPVVGETIRRRGKLWTVKAKVNREVMPIVHVEPAPTDVSTSRETS